MCLCHRAPSRTGLPAAPPFSPLTSPPSDTPSPRVALVNPLPFEQVLLLRLCHSLCACSVVSDSLLPHGLQPARLLCPRGSPGTNTGVGCHVNTGVGCHALLQGVFPPRTRTRVSCTAGRFFTAEPHREADVSHSPRNRFGEKTAGKVRLLRGRLCSPTRGQRPRVGGRRLRHHRVEFSSRENQQQEPRTEQAGLMVAWVRASAWAPRSGWSGFHVEVLPVPLRAESSHPEPATPA